LAFSLRLISGSVLPECGGCCFGGRGKNMREGGKNIQEGGGAGAGAEGSAKTSGPEKLKQPQIPEQPQHQRKGRNSFFSSTRPTTITFIIFERFFFDS
jgi:hypothetical protein